MRNRAFTLTEVLIAIAIVSVLAVILFPAFVKARERSRLVSCLSNEKQIGEGIVQYTQDYDGYYCPANKGIGGWQLEIRWYDSVSPYIPHNRGIADSNGHQYGRGGVWHCPAFPSSQQANYGVHEYAFPGAIDGNGGLTSRVINQALVETPANFIIVLEKGQNDGNASWPFFNAGESHWTDTVGNPPGTVRGADWSVASGGPDASSGLSHNCDLVFSASGVTGWGGDYGNCGSMPRYRHQNSCNVVYADGHVKSMKAGSLSWFTNVYDPSVFAAAGQPQPN